jgi:hypothetical protein
VLESLIINYLIIIICITCTMSDSKHRSIVVETREEKEKLLDIMSEFKVIYFYGEYASGKSFIQKKFKTIHPDIDIFETYPEEHPNFTDDGCSELKIDPSIHQIIKNCRTYIFYKIRDIYPKTIGSLTDPHHYDEYIEKYPITIFIQTNKYYEDVIKVYPECLIVEFKNSELESTLSH